MSTARANRPVRDKPNKSQATENTNSEQQASTVKNQPTAEQMRLAQMITTESNKGEDPVIKAKIQQVIELTGRSENDALFALYDVNYDLNRAVEKLLESADSQNEWQEISKKKKAQPVAKVEPVVALQKQEGKREKSKDRDVERTDRSEPRSRRDRGPPRFQRGRGRDRGSTEENERHKSDNTSGERNFERTERGGRGRGRGGGAGRGRGRGRGSNFRGTRFDQSKDKGPHIDTWTNEQAQTTEKENIGSWGDMTEDWTADEWQGSLEDTKVFTASKVQNDTSVYTSPNVQNDSSVFSSMNDNDAKMFTPPPPTIETQVFTATSISNSSVSPTLNDTTNTFQHGSSPLQQNSLPQGTIGHNSLAQNSLTQNSLGQNSLGQRLDLGALFPKTAEPTSSLSQQQSQFMSQFTKEATESIKNAVGIGSSAAGQQPSVGMPPANDSSRNLVQTGQASNNQRAKTQRTRLPPPSKIPASAVEMPGGMNFQLDVQFGNLDYPSTLPESNASGLGFGSPINSTGTISNSYTPTPVSVTPTKPQSSTGISNLDSLNQSNSQSPRGSGGVFPPPTNSTPPKDYSQSSLGKPTMPSPPETLQYPNSQERKPSPYVGQRSGPAPGTISSNKPSSSPMTFSQSSYSSSYQSATYKPAHTSSSSSSSVSSASSYSHTTNGLSSGSLSSHGSGLQGQNQYNSTGGYQSSSFQNNSGFSSSNQGQSSLYQNSTNQSNSYSPQTGGSTSFSSGSGSGSVSSYQNQSGSYQSQSTGGYPSQSYSSRDTRESRESSHAGQSGSAAYQSNGATQQPGSSYQASVTQSSSVSSSSSTSYQRDSQSGGQSGYGHQGYSSSSQNPHQNSLSSSKLSDSIGKISLSDTSLDGPPSAQYDHTSSASSSASLTTTTSTTSSSLASGSVGVSASLGLTNSTASSTAGSGTSKNALPVSTKAPPNLPPGVPLIQNYMTIGQPGIAPFAFASLAGQQPFYSYEDLQVLQQRIPLLGHSYDLPLQPPATTLPGRDQTAAATLASAPFSSTGADKLSRVDAQSPVNAQTSQQQATQPAHQQQQQQQQQQQAFINPTALPPGYNYYYPTGGVLPGGYSYPPTMFPVPSVTNAAHGGSTASVQFQKPGGYGSHAYGSAGQNQDFTKGYSSASTVQNKVSSGTMAVSSASDLTGTGTNYGKTHAQSFDKAGFHAGTPPPFNLPLPAGTQAGPMGAPTAYGAQYVPVMTHQPHSHQPHSQLLHHPLQQESAGGSGRAAQQTGTQNKGPVTKNYSAYWGSN